MPGTPPTSAPLGWAQAASSWFRKDYDVLGRVFVVTATFRLVLAIHTVVVSLWFVYPTARNRIGLLISMAAVLLWTFFVTFLLRRPTDRNLWVHLADGAVTCSLIFATPRATIKALAEHLGCSRRTAERLVAGLRRSGRLARHGSTRAGTWRVIGDAGPT